MTSIQETIHVFISILHTKSKMNNDRIKKAVCYRFHSLTIQILHFGPSYIQLNFIKAGPQRKKNQIYFKKKAPPLRINNCSHQPQL